MKYILALVLSAFSLAAAPPLADMPETFAPGLTLTIHSAGQTDTRAARLAAIYVDPQDSPTPFLKPGPFTATFTGAISTRIRDTITLSAFGHGSVKITLNDQPALVSTADDLSTAKGLPVKLLKGKNKITIEYASPANGPAELRLFWSSETFPPEPIPPTSFVHDISDKTLRTQSRLRDARQLFADLRCAKCHADASVLPELSPAAPDLSSTGSRLNAAWVAAWIADPKSLRPQAHMPQLLHDPKQIADVTAYLMTLASPVTGSASEADTNAGARLYTSLGCIACHTPPDAAKPDPARIPHNQIAAKYQPAALQDFLKQPDRHYAATRMPNFHLSNKEVSQLSAYLLTKSPKPTGDAPKGDATAGATVFKSAGCANCHTTTPEKLAAPLADLLKTDFSKGCLAKDPGKAPNFALTDDQRAALQALAAGGIASLTQDTPIEAAERHFTTLNCSACHSRDNQGDNWSDLKEEIAAIESALPPAPDTGEKYAPDQSRPQLTFAGEKLKPEFMETFISGKLSYKPRPFIYARMPSFAAYAHLLAAGFSNQHGYSATSPPDPAPDASQIPIGQRLVGKTGGFSCNACHAIASAPALAAFEAPAPNFAHVKDRLRYDYYIRWVRNPLRVDRTTRMPTFANADGKTTIRDVYDGDAIPQYNAIWNYLLQGPAVQPPGQ